jgi:CheY-like chemotaxis protein
LARKILLADDSVTAQNMGRKILTDAGYEVVTVNNGSAALKKIAEGKPDLIVLDVYMPGYSGLEVCQRIKENRETARIPILLTVGKLEPFKPEEARRARADAFVVKPFEASELLSALTKLEDKIIPGAEPYKQGRFAKAVASVDDDGTGEKFGDSDGGWKARLRIPTGKPKEAEPTVDYATTQGKGFRDYPDPSSKPAPSVSQSSAMPERSLPAGIPHDITPEEIAAITAAAAQLSGAAAPQPQAAAPVEAVSESTNHEAPQESTDAPVTFASSPAISESLESASEVGLTAAAHPLPHPETVSEAASIQAEVNPVVTSPGISGEASSALTPEGPSTSPSAEVDLSSGSAFAESSAPLVADAGVTATPLDELPVIESPVETVEAPSVVHASSAGTVAEAPAVTSSDDEVMAALQTLIPQSEKSEGGHDSSANGAGETFPAHSAHPRWIAEPISLAANETTVSLEQEMAAAYGIVSAHAVHASTMPVEPINAVPSAPAFSEPKTIDQPAVQEMASAAAVGEGAQPYSSPGSVNSPDPTAADSATAITPSFEAPVTTVPTASEPPQEATHSIEGDVMAASWKNIRDSIAGAAAKPAPAKDDFRDAESSAHDQIVNVAAEQAAAKLKASDPTAIAHIVDSVLAELRPKIVEEIARKLSDPKKE